MRDAERQRRGFAVMPQQQVRSIASMGGKAAHENGRAHEWTYEEAHAAGRKGGLASAARRREQRAADDEYFRSGTRYPGQ